MPRTIEPPRQDLYDALAGHMDASPENAFAVVRELVRLEADAGERAAAIRARALLESAA